MRLEQFIGKSELAVMRSNCRGEEGEFFRQMIADLKGKIASMPKTYETEEVEEDAKVCVLHYFLGGSDWWIVERDMEDEQLQAFGYACLNGDYEMAELGYINIQELIENGVELDLYWKPVTLGEIKAKCCLNSRPSWAA